MVIHDGFPAHRAIEVKTLIRKSEGMIQVHRLPAYNPDLNALEMLWGMGKRQVSRYGARAQEALLGAVNRFYRRLRPRRRMLRQTFQKALSCSAS